VELETKLYQMLRVNGPKILDTPGKIPAVWGPQLFSGEPS